MLAKRHILPEFHQKFYSLALILLGKDYRDVGGVFGEGINQRFSKAVVELEMCARIAMGDSHKIVSNL